MENEKPILIQLQEILEGLTKNTSIADIAKELGKPDKVRYIGYAVRLAGFKVERITKWRPEEKSTTSMAMVIVD